MVRHTLKILQHLLQDFQSVSDKFGTLYIKELILENALKGKINLSNEFVVTRFKKPENHSKHLFHFSPLVHLYILTCLIIVVYFTLSQ